MAKKLDKRTKEYKEYLKLKEELKAGDEQNKEFIKANPRGLGDKIANAISKTGLDKLLPKDCGCAKRREWLNSQFPVRFKAKRCFTDEEMVWYKNYMDTRTLNLVSKEDLDMLMKMHKEIFNWQVLNLCHNCSGSASIIRGMIERLDKMYLSY